MTREELLKVCGLFFSVILQRKQLNPETGTTEKS